MMSVRPCCRCGGRWLQVPTSNHAGAPRPFPASWDDSGAPTRACPLLRDSAGKSSSQNSPRERRGQKAAKEGLATGKRACSAIASPQLRAEQKVVCQIRQRGAQKKSAPGLTATKTAGVSKHAQ